MHKSIATIDTPEFINLKPVDLNPLMSSCEIKVLYIGENRNHSFISKEVATEMAKTLRGAPIVGYYNKNTEDFADHGERVTIDNEGVKFECLTKPYGYVAPDARVWFQKFDDTDEFGNVETREYLMTTGYLWTGQFEECNVAVTEGRPHSMELQEETLQGHWATNKKSGMDFFIINDATFTKLCILGDDVEPCFEGSSVTAPNVSTSYSLDKDFKTTLFQMMEDLKKLYGGQQMENNEEKDLAPETAFAVTSGTEAANTVVTPDTDFAAPKDNEEEEDEKAKKDAAKCAKSDDDDKDDDKEDDAAPKKDDDKEDDEEDENKKKFALLESQYAELNAKYEELQNNFNLLSEENASLKTANEELTSFKASIEDAEKDAMIESFYMLSEEDKKDVIENKSKYSVEDIESKLSVICVRKKVNFSSTDNSENNIDMNKPVVTFNLSDDEASVPAWVKACENTQKNNRK